MRYVLKGTQGNLTKDIVENVKVSYPNSKSEMKQIVSILSKINEQITHQQSHLSNLKTMRKSILNSKLTPKMEEKLVAK